MNATKFLLAYRFLAVGAANTVFGLSVIFSLMYFFELNPAVSNLIGYAFGLILGYFLNKNWTFKYKDVRRKGFFLYLLVILMAYLLNIGLVYSGIKYFLLNHYVAQIGGMILYTTVSFVGCNRIVFRFKE